MRTKALLALAATVAISAANAADIRLVPSDQIILNPTNPGKGYYDLVLHTVGVATGPAEFLTISDLSIELVKGASTVLTKRIAPDRLVAETEGLTAPPENIFLPFQLFAMGGVDEFFGRHVSPASSPNLQPSQFVLATRQHFSVDFEPDLVRVSLTGKDAKGKTVATSTSIKIAEYRTPIVYRLPVQGAWAMHSLPSIESHHRLNPSTEFAVDFFKPDATGADYHDGPQVAEHWYAYGAPVLAAAGGVVVRVIDDVRQDRAARFPKPGETPDAYNRRIGDETLARYAKDFPRASAGNLITIKHESGAVTEYSSYGHLNARSIKVHAGDHVTQGQIIAQVGDTGDSPVVHLHFQINAGPDAFASKSLPAMFADEKDVGSSHDPGKFITNQK